MQQDDDDIFIAMPLGKDDGSLSRQGTPCLAKCIGDAEIASSMNMPLAVYVLMGLLLGILLDAALALWLMSF